MRAGIHGAGIAIERVLNPTISPARRFHGVVDTVFTLALGSVCAFALTLGPAPLNTLAAVPDGPPTLDALGQAPASGSLLPDEVGAASPMRERAKAEQRAASTRPPEAPPASAVDSSSKAQSPTAPRPQASTPALPIPLPTPIVPADQLGTGVSGTVATALGIVEGVRTAAGLAPFVDSDSCTAPTAWATIQVTPSQILLGGLATASLAPDPAHAAATSTDSWPVSVTVYSCT